MSLVAYDTSSDESDCENSCTQIIKTSLTTNNNTLVADSVKENTDLLQNTDPDGLSLISEDDKQIQPIISSHIGRLQLPPPKQQINDFNKMSLETILTNSNSSIFDNISTTSSVISATAAGANMKETIDEEDDEFLHIPPQRHQIVEDLHNRIPSSLNTKTCSKSDKKTQQIFIPSLKDFEDVEDVKPKSSNIKKPVVKPSGLLDILPKAKQEMQSSSNTSLTSNKLMIPKSVTNRSNLNKKINELQIANNSSNTKKMQSTSINSKNNERKSVSNWYCNMDDSEDEANDDEINSKNFFSLDTDDNENSNNRKDVQICEKEVNELIAKRAAEMQKAKQFIVEYTGLIAEIDGKSYNANSTTEDLKGDQNQSIHKEDVLDLKALEELVGSRGKRKRYNMDKIEVIDLSSDKMLPDREDWMRSALSASTTDEPKPIRRIHKESAGNLKRRHQITYLMDRAIANDADLKAMWATNNQTRRITSGKYGF